MARDTRAVSWVKAARKDFERFPQRPRTDFETALTIAAEGRMADSAKAMKGLGAGVFEIALRYRTDAYRVVYAVRIDADVWVIHAFQKKSHTGIKTPKPEIDLIRQRLRRLHEELR
jgi:phage-related protein